MKISEKSIDVPIDLLEDPFSHEKEEDFGALKAIEAHHKILTRNVSLKANSLRRASENELVAVGDNLSNYFKTQVFPHADAEEQTMYTKATAVEQIDLETMIDEHRQLKITLLEFDSESDMQTKINLGLQIKDLFQAHVQKENQELIPAIFNSKHLSLSSLVQDLHHNYQNIIDSLNLPDVKYVNIDVRDIIPAERHPAIFGAFEALAPFHGILLINDHDPIPLFYQFESEYSAQFSWEYLQMGPTVWRVSIIKL